MPIDQRSCRAWAWACALLVAAPMALAAPMTRHAPSEVLLVYNANSTISTAVADYYAQHRAITHTLAVTCADAAVDANAETIASADYTSQIGTPIRNYLAQHTGINFIVLTKGMPLRIDGAATGSKDFGSAENLRASLDSSLAALDYASTAGAVKIKITGSGASGSAWLNRYWNATVPFSHAAFGGYLVTRLDGYTQADAIALVDRALAAEQGIAPYGQVLLDAQPDFGTDDKTVQPLPVTGDISAESDYGSWNGDLARAADLLEVSAIPATADLQETFVGNRARLLGYFSWGSNDPAYSDTAYRSLLFAPGAIGDTAVSTSARTFLPTSGGQSLVADLVANGITAVKGYSNEPLLQGIASPSLTLGHYLGGFSMAESFYAASRFVGWEDIVLGDPLGTPFYGNTVTVPHLAAQYDGAFDVASESCREGGQDVGFIAADSYLEYDNIALDGVYSFSARVASPNGGASIAIRQDAPTGPLLGTCIAPQTDDWQVYADTYCALAGAAGVHALYLTFSPGLNLQWFSLQGRGSSIVSSLPSPWLENDIGMTGVAGSAIHSNGSGNFTLNGAGAGSAGASDTLHYVHQDNAGNTALVAHVTSLGNGNAAAEAGLMVRASLDPDSVSAALIMDASGNLTFRQRVATGTNVTQVVLPQSLPLWLELVQHGSGTGSTFTTAYSNDGLHWSAIGTTVAIPMPSQVETGLTVASHVVGHIGSATFDNVTLLPLDIIFANGFD